MTENRYLGKFRGSVVNNIDPLQRGRLQAMVPDVLGSVPSSWAEPCVPFAGIQAGLWSVPPISAGVWVEFEQGDPEHPVWTGSWWGSAAEVPALAMAVPPAISHVLVQTTAQNTISVSDAPGPAGGLLLKSSTGAMIMINETGITISNGQGATIMLAGTSVIINNGALTVL
jgi:uncharacterized protein involved in type VI secretion and phage assembly